MNILSKNLIKEVEKQVFEDRVGKEIHYAISDIARTVMGHPKTPSTCSMLERMIKDKLQYNKMVNNIEVKENPNFNCFDIQTSIFPCDYINFNISY